MPEGGSLLTASCLTRGCDGRLGGGRRSRGSEVWPEKGGLSRRGSIRRVEFSAAPVDSATGCDVK